MKETVTQRLRFAPEDREAGYYRYVGFEVEAGVEAISVAIEYDRSSAVIDLGLFGPEGFRGWSGGARSSLCVARSWATPGYLPGPLVAGEWEVVLGLYEVPTQGVDVSIEIATSVRPPPPRDPMAPLPAVPPAPVLARPPASRGRRWVAGDLHSHSEHSDGGLSVPALAALARGRGLDFLAVTDHNTVSHHVELPPAARRYGITLLPGQEITTPQGHANCLGGGDWVDFRAPADDWSIGADEGRLLSINHPVTEPWGWHLAMVRQADLVEAWHSSWDRRTADPIDWWSSLGRAVPVGGSDFHRLGQRDATARELLPGCPTTWVEVDDDGPGPPAAAAVLAGLREGRVAVSCAPAGPVVTRDEGELVVVSGGSATLVRAAGGSAAIEGEVARLPGGPGMAWIEGRDGEILAFVP
ncbi:MAG: CehA/McbA family metallohydrolase [Acidimicrobiales bacterium]